MINSIVFMARPLPDALIAKYFHHCLEDSLFTLRRQIRLARMVGRFGEPEETRLSLMPLILQSMLEDGIRTTLPLSRIEPGWTPEILSVAMHLYLIEARNLRSAPEMQPNPQTFQEIDSSQITNPERSAQIGEAYITARLATMRQDTMPTGFPRPRACTTVVDTPIPTDSAASDAAVFDALREPTVSAAPVTPTRSMEMTVASAPTPPVTTPDAFKVRTLAPKSVCRTMATLDKHFVACKDEALAVTGDLAATPECWSTDIAQVFWRTAREEGMTDAVKGQRCSDVRRFMLILGITCVSQITQVKLTHWHDILKDFPKDFLRSNKDFDRNLEQILLGAKLLPPEKKGLSSGTRNRHMKSIELVIRRAIAEGVPLGHLDLKNIKPKKSSSRNRHKARATFREDELRHLFRHTLWTGAKSAGRRHEPGNVVTRDGAWWIPLILAYTGARRAEIAGMLTDDVKIIDKIPAFIIQANQYRGIKGEPVNAQAEDKLTRIVPIHSQLLDLGLLEYVEAAHSHGHPLLFPDVVPEPRKGSPKADVEDRALLVEKLGERYDDAWRQCLKRSLAGNPRKLCIHSLRHYVNSTLLHAAGVHEVVRLDLLGHIEGAEKQNTNTSTYREETSMAIKRNAIEKLPWIM